MINSVIILAGGIGSRMGEDLPKQYIKINNKMIIDYSIKEFLKNNYMNKLIIVCKERWIQKLKTKYPKATFIIGGKTRSESTQMGLKACDLKTENVLIHDAARPLINQGIINSCIENLENNDAVIPVIDCDNAMIDIDKMNYINRESTKIIQTPQAFKFKKILNAYKKLNKTYVDDFSVLLNYNKLSKYKFIDGLKKNIKITSSQDCILMENYLNEK